MNLPMFEELYLAPKLSRPDSESRCLPVKWSGLVLVTAPTQERASPKGLLVQVWETLLLLVV